MALRSVTDFHPGRSFPRVTAMDSPPILPDSAKGLNSRRDSALAIPRAPADLPFFDQAVSVRRRDLVTGTPSPVVYPASPNSADPFDSRDSVPGFADLVVPDY